MDIQTYKTRFSSNNYTKCATKDDITIWNDKPKRDFIFTEDAADAILKLIKTNYTGVINLGQVK